MTLRGLDAWLTRGPWDEEEPPAPRCGRCGGFLRRTADRTEPWEDGIDCDGTVTLHPQEYDEALIAILGEEYRGKTYDVAVSPCGIDLAAHEPHREIMAAGVTEHRLCRRCGHQNAWSEM